MFRTPAQVLQLIQKVADLERKVADQTDREWLISVVKSLQQVAGALEKIAVAKVSPHLHLPSNMVGKMEATLIDKRNKFSQNYNAKPLYSSYWRWVSF